MTSAGEGYNNQRDKMTKFVNFFHQPHLSLHNKLINKMAMVVRIEVMPGISNMCFQSLRLTWLVLSAQYSSNRKQG